MRLPKNGRPSELNNTANAGRIVRGRNGRKILPAFLLTVFVAALAIAAIPQEKKARRNRFGADQEKSFVKAVRTIRQENRQGRGKLPPLYAAVRVRRRPCGVSYILRSVAGRITGHRRSLPQPGSAAWCPRLLTRAEVKDLLTAAY